MHKVKIYQARKEDNSVFHQPKSTFHDGLSSKQPRQNHRIMRGSLQSADKYGKHRDSVRTVIHVTPQQHIQKVLQFIQKQEHVPAVSDHGIMFMQTDAQQAGK